jgi:hypothetical protein
MGNYWLDTDKELATFRGPGKTLLERLYPLLANSVRVERAPERRIFYVDVGQLSPEDADHFMERMKEKLRSK